MTDTSRPDPSTAPTSPPSPSVSPEVLSAHLQGEAVLLDLASHRYYQLNATAALAWRHLERGGDPSGIPAALTHHFEVDTDEALAASERILHDLRTRGLVQDRAPEP